jgi:hypothetical protein
MIVKIKNLDSSRLLNIDFFEMRDKGFIPDVNAHRSDSYFDLTIKGIKGFNVGSTRSNVIYNLYSSNVDISPFTLILGFEEELMILKEVKNEIR